MIRWIGFCVVGVLFNGCGAPANQGASAVYFGVQDGKDDYDWRSQILLSAVPAYPFTGNSHGSAYYQDIMGHTPAKDRYFGNGWSTEAHESLHGLVSVMRNSSTTDDGFFYHENGQGAYVLQPKRVMAKVRDYVGAKFKVEAKSRYQLYLVQQAAYWPEVLYLFDEWNAYVATSRSAVEMLSANQWDNQNGDPFDGTADFLYFCSAAVMTLKDHDPQFFAGNTQFKATYAMLAEQSMAWVKEGQKFDLWKTSVATKRINMLRMDAENENLRTTIRDFMGAEWTLRVLGF